MNNKEILIIKAVNKFNKPANINVNFEEFDDLFLTKLENKKKLKAYKRQELFNYKLFHEKERERLNRHKKNSDGLNECVIMKSPPRKRISQRLNQLLLSQKISQHQSMFSNVDIIKAPSPVPSPSSSVVPDPIVYSSPKKYDTILIVKSKSPPESISNTSSVRSSNGSRGIKSPKSLSKLISSGMRFSAKSPRISQRPSRPSRPSRPPKSSRSTSPDSTQSRYNQSPISQISPVNSRIELVSPMNNYSRRTSKFSSMMSIASNSSKNKIPFILKKSIKTIKTISSVSSFNSSVMSGISKQSRVVDKDDATKLDASVKSFRGKYIASNASFKSNVVDSLVHKVNSRASDTSSVNEDDEKRELLFKFQLLSNKNPALVSKYPFTMRSDLKVMKNTYKMILKQISVNNRVDNLNTYLLAGFMVCEYLFGKIGFDMEGFSKQQIASMKSYESLLIELGEKEYTPYGMENWSVEFRLMATLVFNAFWFIVAKSISKKTNFDIIGFMADKKEVSATQEKIMSPLLNQEKKMKGLRDISSS